MAENLDALWEQAKPIAKPREDDLDALWEQGKPVEQVDPVTGYVRAGLNSFYSATGVGADELVGAIEATYDRNEGEGFGDARRRHTQDYRALQKTSREQNPKASIAGDVTGALASGVVLNKAGLLRTPGSLAQLVRQGAALGALNSFAESDADVFGGETAKAAGDAAQGAAFGAAASGTLGALGKGVRAGGAWLRERAARGLQSATGDAAALATKAVDSSINQARSSLGGKTSSASRTLELLERALADPSLSAEDRAAAQAFLSSTEGQALRAGVLKSAIGRAGEELPSVQQAAAEYAKQKAGRATEIAGQTEQLMSPATALEQVKERAQRYLPPVIGDIVGRGTIAGGLVGTAVGGALGGDWQSAGMGALAGAGLRPAIHSVRRMLQHPSVRGTTWRGVMVLANAIPESLGEYGPELAKAAARGEKAFAATYYALTKRDPDLGKRMASAVADAESEKDP